MNVSVLCTSIYNKMLEFWNLVHTYNPDVIIGTESWLKGQIENADVFRTDYTTFRRDRSVGEGGFSYALKIPLKQLNYGWTMSVKY